MKTKRYSCWLIAALLTSACGENPPSSPTATLASEHVPTADSRDFSLVQQATFDRAFATVKAIDYLPFGYLLDGCYARALYMAMELAAVRIESNALFAFANNGDYPLEVGDISWSYHVAPLLYVDGDAVEDWIIDPGLSDKPLSTKGWLAAMGRRKPEMQRNDQGEEVDVGPEMLMVPGSRYAPMAAERETTYRNRDLPNFESLPPFEADDIESACTIMHYYLGEEHANGVTDTKELTRKRKQLIAKTGQLVHALDGLNKLNRANQDSDDDFIDNSNECRHAVRGKRAPSDPSAAANPT